MDVITDRAERTEPGAEFVTEEGTLVLADARPHQKRWLFRFEGHDSREHVETIRGTQLWAEPLDDADTLWVHELVGCAVLEGDIERGTVVAVRANPASDLLELDSGALVPVTFVVGPPEQGDGDAPVVRVDAPDGLFDL